MTIASLPLTPPPLPDWEGWHPLIVHFPVALLLTVPLLVLLSLLPRIGAGFRLAALVLLILGTAAAYVAVESGEASARVISFTPEAQQTLEAHEELAETVRLLFTVLTGVYVVVLLVPVLTRKVLKKNLPRAVPVVLTVLFFLAAGACVNVLANAAHLGGQLVFKHRVENWLLQ